MIAQVGEKRNVDEVNQVDASISKTKPEASRESSPEKNKRVRLDDRNGNSSSVGSNKHNSRKRHTSNKSNDSPSKNQKATNEIGEKDHTADGEDNEGRLPKKKCAISFGYCGIGYSGLQVNNDVKTIEGDIFEAFCKVGAISKENASNPKKVGLQRAARTDRGVHAAGNLLTLKLILEPPGIGPGELADKINEILPDCIRIWGFTRVQAGFNARTSCDSRHYEYMLPTYALLPPKPGTLMYEMMKRWSTVENENESKANESDEYEPTLEHLLNHPFWKQQGTSKTYEEDVQAKKKWRLPKGHLEKIREMFQMYVGSHNFHNFTVGKPFRDRSARRHMLDLKISEPKIINNTEWLSIKFHGQSFMLHQIRKMIGLLIMMGRTNAPASLVLETFGPARIHVPKAPGLGLLLEEPLFEGYNRRLVETMKRQNEGPFSDARCEGLVPKEEVLLSRYNDKMEHFKQKWIYDRIFQEEEEKHEYTKFLQYLDVLSGTDFEYLNPKGIIPQNAILKVGELVRPGLSGENANKNDKNEKENQIKKSITLEVEDDDDEELLQQSGDQEEFEG